MKLGVTLDILNQKATPAFYADTLANRPAAGFTGRVFISTDTLDLYRDTGTTWVLLSPSSTGTITGSGAAGQVTYFSAASSITGSNNLFYDTGNSRLGINTNTPTAPLDVHSSLSGALMQLNQTSGILDSQLAFQSANVGKWRIGSYYNTGLYSFGIYDVVNSIERFSVLNTGQTFIGSQTTSSGLLVVNSSTADNQIVAIGANSPSIRVRNAGTSPTQQFGLGLATATNNFIQGSASGDFCLFNGSTTASPMLFGIYDAGLTNVQEAARISAARNFLVGSTTDNGAKLQVNGNETISGKLGVGTTTLGSYIFNVSGSVPTLVNFNSTNVSGFYTTYSTSSTERAYIGLGTNTITGLSISDFGIVGSSNIVFASGSGGTETLRMSSSKNLLIGTTTDNGAKLQVNGNGSISGNLTIGGYNNNNKLDIITSNRTSLTAASGGINVNYNGSTLGEFQTIGFSWASSIDYNSRWGMGITGTNFGSGLADLFFYVGGNRQMTINSFGRILIGTLTDDLTSKLQVNGSIAIGNTVTSAIGIASTHKVSILINGVQYYLLASNV
jgi:hypothetical protein